MIDAIRQGLKEDGYEVSINKLRGWLNVPRRTYYYRSHRKPAVVQEKLVVPIRQLIEEHRSSATARLQATVLELEHGAADIPDCRSKKRSADHRPCSRPCSRWPNRLISAGRPTCAGYGRASDGWAVLALVMDCSSRELLGWNLSRSGKSRIAEAALEEALTHGSVRPSSE